MQNTDYEILVTYQTLLEMYKEFDENEDAYYCNCAERIKEHHWEDSIAFGSIVMQILKLNGDLQFHLFATTVLNYHYFNA